MKSTVNNKHSASVVAEDNNSKLPEAPSDAAARIPSFPEEADYLRAELARVGLSVREPKLLKPVKRVKVMGQEFVLQDYYVTADPVYACRHSCWQISRYGWMLKACMDEVRGPVRKSGRPGQSPCKPFAKHLAKAKEELALPVQVAFSCLEFAPYNIKCHLAKDEALPIEVSSISPLGDYNKACYDIARYGVVLAARAEAVGEALDAHLRSPCELQIAERTNALMAHLRELGREVFLPAAICYHSHGVDHVSLPENLQEFNKGLYRLELATLRVGTDCAMASI